MNGNFPKHWPPPGEETLPPQQRKFASRVCRIGVGTVLCLIVPTLADAQSVPNSPPSADGKKCAALTQLNLKDAPGGPAVITSAHLVDVPSTGLPRFIMDPSGFGNAANMYATSIHPSALARSDPPLLSKTDPGRL